MAHHTNHARNISIPAQQGYLLLHLLGRLLHEKPVQINIDSPYQLYITVTYDNHMVLSWIISMGKTNTEPVGNQGPTSSQVRVSQNTEQQMGEDTDGSPLCVTPLKEPYQSPDVTTRPDFIGTTAL